MTSSMVYMAPTCITRIWHQAQRPLVAGKSIRYGSHVPLQHAQVVVRLSIARRSGNRCLQQRQCLPSLALAGQHNSQVVQTLQGRRQGHRGSRCAVLCCGSYCQGGRSTGVQYERQHRAVHSKLPPSFTSAACCVCAACRSANIQ